MPRVRAVEGGRLVLQAMQRRLPGKGSGEDEQIGEDHVEARLRLVQALQMAVARKGMTQVQAARLLGTDQPMLSKVLRGRTASVSLDKLVCWLVILGQSVEIEVFEPVAPALPSFTAKISGLSNA